MGNLVSKYWSVPQGRIPQYRYWNSPYMKKSLMFKTFFSYILILSSLVLFPWFDLLNKYSLRFGSGISYSIFIRAIYEFLFIVYISIFIDVKKVKYLMFLILLTALWNFNAMFFFQETKSFFINFICFNKYIFSLIIGLVAMDIPKDRWFVIFKIFEWLFFINAILVILGLIFNISIFRTYPYDYRWGFSGIVPAQNEATFFWIAGIIYFYFKNQILKIEDKKFWIILISSLFVGTKGIWFFLIPLLFFYLCKVTFLKKIKFSLKMLILLIGISSIFKKQIVLLTQFFIYNYKNYSIFTFLLSSRNIKFEENFVELIQKKWNFINYLWGGQDVSHHYTEMAFCDLIAFLGIFGSFLYLFLWKRLVFNFSLRKKFNLFVFILILLIAGLGGHFFSSAINAIYYVILGKYIKINEKLMVRNG